MNTDVSQARSETASGRVVTVHGSVIDIDFADGDLPPINDAVAIDWDVGAPLIAEVQQHLGARRVRTVALESAAGLKRGVRVHATGAPVRAPVGEAVLGRLLNALGEPMDRARKRAAVDRQCLPPRAGRR